MEEMIEFDGMRGVSPQWFTIDFDPQELQDFIDTYITTNDFTYSLIEAEQNRFKKQLLNDFLEGRIRYSTFKDIIEGKNPLPLDKTVYGRF